MRKTSTAGLFTRSVHLAAIGAQSAKARIPVWIHQIRTCLMMCVRKRRGVAHVSSCGGETGHCPSCIIHACHVRPWGCVSVCEQHETTWVHIVSVPSSVLRDPKWYPAAFEAVACRSEETVKVLSGLSRKPVYSGSNEDWWHMEFCCQYNQWSSPLLTHNSLPSVWACERSWSELWDLSRFCSFQFHVCERFTFWKIQMCVRSFSLNVKTLPEAARSAQWNQIRFAWSGQRLLTPWWSSTLQYWCVQCCCVSQQLSGF